MSGDVTTNDDRREIVVTIDTAACAPPAIALAVALAQARRQALHGLFLEDENLLKVARLPFSREFHRVSGRARSMSDQRLERAMARMAGEFRTALEQQATQYAVRWSCSTLRGDRVVLARAQTANAELLVVAAPRGQTSTRPEHILVLDWDRAAVLKALANVLETRRGPMEIMLTGDGDREPVRLLLKAYPGCTLRELGSTTPEAVFRSPAVRPSLVLTAGDAEPEWLEVCLQLARCPVLIVGRQP